MVDQFAGKGGRMGMAPDSKSFYYSVLLKEIQEGWAFDNPGWFEATLNQAIEKNAITEAEKQELNAELARLEKSILRLEGETI